MAIDDSKVKVESFNEERVKSFLRQFKSMLTNHPEREKTKVVVNLKAGENDLTEEIEGFFKCDCDICKKIEEKIRKLKTLDEFRFMNAKVEKSPKGEYVTDVII